MITFSGLRSWWIASCRWMLCSASATAAPRRATSPRRERSLAHDRLQARAVDPLDHQVGIGRDVSGAAEARHVRAREHRQDQAFSLEAEERARALAGRDARQLDDRGKSERLRGRGAGDAENAGHRAGVDHLAQREAVDLPRRFGSVGRLRVHLDVLC